MTNNTMVKKIREGKPVFGSFVKVNEPRLIECFGRAGFDYVILDAEHGTYNFSQMENLIRAADITNMSTVIRVPDCTEHSILHALDAGAGAVQVPSLRDVEVTRFGAQFSKYYPKGIRGMCTDQRSNDYGFNDAGAYFKYANENTLFIPQVETLEMVNHVEELCELELVDGLFIGPGDLSQALGMPGKMRSPEVMEVIRHVTKVALNHGKFVGTIVMDPKDLDEFLDMGMLYMSVSTDMMLFNDVLTKTASYFDAYR